MRDASSRLFQSLFDAYDDRWDGGQDLGEVVEVSLTPNTDQHQIIACHLDHKQYKTNKC